MGNSWAWCMQRVKRWDTCQSGCIPVRSKQQESQLSRGCCKEPADHAAHPTPRAPQTWSNAKLQATIIGSSTNDGQLRCVFILPAGEHAKVGGPSEEVRVICACTGGWADEWGSGVVGACKLAWHARGSACVQPRCCCRAPYGLPSPQALPLPVIAQEPCLPAGAVQVGRRLRGVLDAELPLATRGRNQGAAQRYLPAFTDPMGRCCSNWPRWLSRV